MSLFDARVKVLLKNVFGSAAARFVNLFIMLALVPLTIKALDSTDYAYFAMSVSLSVLAAYADLGMGLAIVNVVAERGTQSISASAQRAVSVVWFSLLGIAVFGLLSTGLLAAWLNCGTQPGSLRQYNAMLLAVACVFAGLPTGLVQRVLFAEQRNVQANAWNTIGRIISLAAVWVLVKTNHATLMSTTVSVLIAPVLVGWLSVAVVFGGKDFRDLRPEWNLCEFRLSHEYLVLGVSFLVMQLVSFSENNVDSLIVGGLLSTDLVAPLDVYSKLFNYVPAMISIATYPLWPAIASAKTSGDSRWIARARQIGYLGVGALAVITSAAIYWQSETIVHVWTHKNLVLDPLVITGMGVFAVLSALGTMQSMILSGLGIIKRQAVIGFVYAAALFMAKVAAAYWSGLTAMIWAMNIAYFAKLSYAESLFRLSAIIRPNSKSTSLDGALDREN